MAPLKLAPLKLAKPFATLLQDLRQRGFFVWVVGGWVRDCALGVSAHDADFCTDADGESIAQAAKDAHVAILLDRVAAIHGTYRLAAQGEVLDLARLRQDVTRLGARHAEVRFTTELGQDLSRRDLTINALALPYPLPRKVTEKALIDQHGGLGDLASHTLRLIGDPAARLQEDPLRLLRIARFACMDEVWQVEAGTSAAMTNQAHLVPSVSVERRLAEWTRALAMPCPQRFWTLLLACKGHASLLPAALEPAHLARATSLLAAAAPACSDPLLRQCFFALGAVLPTDKARPPPSKAVATAAGTTETAVEKAAPGLTLRPASRNQALALMAPLRFAKTWQETVSHVAAAWVLPGTAYDDETVVRWALTLGPRHLATLQAMCAVQATALKTCQAATAQVLARVEKLRRDRTLWRGQDLNLDAQALFAALEVGEGAVRRWLLLELLVHAWLHPKDNEPAALTAVARQFNPTEGSLRERPAPGPVPHP